jgi:fructose-bisphosphate aldolase class I
VCTSAAAAAAAAAPQDVGLVPIVEPDVSMAGAHTLESALAINTKIQSVLYRALHEHGVFMEGVILKSNIVNPGRQCPVPYRWVRLQRLTA